MYQHQPITRLSPLLFLPPPIFPARRPDSPRGSPCSQMNTFSRGGQGLWLVVSPNYPTRSRGKPFPSVARPTICTANVRGKCLSETFPSVPLDDRASRLSDADRPEGRPLVPRPCLVRCLALLGPERSSVDAAARPMTIETLPRLLLLNSGEGDSTAEEIEVGGQEGVAGPGSVVESGSVDTSTATPTDLRRSRRGRSM